MGRQVLYGESSQVVLQHLATLLGLPPFDLSSEPVKARSPQLSS